MIMSKQIWIGAIIFGAGAVLATTACSSSDSKGGDGGSGGAIVAGSGGGSGSGGSGGAQGGGKIGTKCTADAQCGSVDEGWKCITEGLPNTKGGFCSKECDPSDSGSCSSVKAGAVCAQTTSGGPGICLEGCDAQTPGSCTGRSDVFYECSGVGGCVPFCAWDSHCPEGLKCDPDTNACVATVSDTGTKKIGDACAVGAQPDECKGSRCEPLAQGQTQGVCLGLCDLQDPAAACGGDPTQAICIGGQGMAAGYCVAPCSCNSECASLPAVNGMPWACIAMQGAEQVTGKPGVCFVKQQGATDIPTCATP